MHCRVDALIKLRNRLGWCRLADSSTTGAGAGGAGAGVEAERPVLQVHTITQCPEDSGGVLE